MLLMTMIKPSYQVICRGKSQLIPKYSIFPLSIFLFSPLLCVILFIHHFKLPRHLSFLWNEQILVYIYHRPLVFLRIFILVYLNEGALGKFLRFLKIKNKSDILQMKSIFLSWYDI